MKRGLIVGLVLTLAAVTGAVYTSLPAAAITAQVCARLDDDMYQVEHPSRGQLLTVWSGEAQGARANHGYNVDRGISFQVSNSPVDGLEPLHRFYHPQRGFAVATVTNAQSLTDQGFTQQGVNGYVLTAAFGNCDLAVYELTKNGTYAYATDANVTTYVNAGWVRGGVAFYAAPSDTTVTLAVLGDTQTWVFGSDPRFRNATNWIANHRGADGEPVDFTIHTGDFVNWGWLDQPQFDIATAAMKVLGEAGIPYQVGIGNHDTRVVGSPTANGGYGGGAYVDNPECLQRFTPAYCRSHVLIRETQEFNANLSAADFDALAGQFEPGKLDNAYSTFEAGGKKWLTLSLEMNARHSVIDWANQVAQQHADHNVVLNTHFYLAANGSITTSNAGYGATSGQYLFDNFVRMNDNVKLVFSGHTGQAAVRSDQTVGGTTVFSSLHNDTGTAPLVQVVSIDTRTGSVTGTFTNVNTGAVVPAHGWTTKLQFVG